jgi:putative DNA-invertase from lambdoid prophage Rac
LGRTFAYLRVSRSDLTTDNQQLEIQQGGFAIDAQRMVRETISGSVAAFERPEFRRLVDRLEEGDRIVVTKLDRLGRNAMDVRATVDTLAQQGVGVHCMALGGLDLTSPSGKMTMAVISAVAEMELDLLIERTRAGLRRAVSEGKRLGRRPALSDAQKNDVLVERANGVSLGVLAKRYSVSRAAIQRVEKAARAV